MSTPAAAPAAQAPRAWPLYRAMVGVGLACGLLIVGVFQLTRPIIERNEARALQEAIFEVLPEAASSATFLWSGEGFERVEPGDAGAGEAVHAGYDEAGRLVGIAVEAGGMGYQDVIRLLYGWSFAKDAIVGIRVLESRETPGLGDRIGLDPAFLANFEALDVSLGPGGEALANAVTYVKAGEKRHPWEVEGITGATISSEAVADMLHRSAGEWVPRLRRRLEDFRPAEGGS